MGFFPCGFKSHPRHTKSVRKHIIIFFVFHIISFIPLSFFFVSLLLFSCAEKLPPQSPEELYNEAMRKAGGGLFRADFDTAEEYLRKIIELYPGSKYVPYAWFGLAYVKMKRGDCAEAGVLFETFYQRYRAHPKAPEALYWAIKCNVKFVDTPDRDISYAEKVRKLANEFLSFAGAQNEGFQDGGAQNDGTQNNGTENEKKNLILDEVKRIREEVLSIVAEHHLKVAEFYVRRKVVFPAIERLKIILEDSELSQTPQAKKAREMKKELEEKIKKL